MKKIQVPDNFTALRELRADWPRVVKRVPIPYRGYLSFVEVKMLGLYSKNYRLPVLAIQHEQFVLLNKDIGLLNSIAGAVNSQLVNKVSGVRFVKPMEDKERELIGCIIDEFDAELVDVEL